MDNQHEKISGYRSLTQEEINIMNRIKAVTADYLKFLEELDRVQKENLARIINDGHDAERARLELAQPGRWLAIARTHIQQGCMAAVRAVAQPADGL